MKSVMARRAGLVGMLILSLVVACAPRTGAPPAGTGQAPNPQGANPQAVADVYRGNTIRIIVGFSAGGGFDTTARLVAKHLGKHVPGNPNVIVENMDGAGSLIALNHVANAARPDGLTLGVFNELQLNNQLLGGEGVQFDARKLGWVGTTQQATTACTIRSDSPYANPQDLLRRDAPPLVFGGTAPGSASDDFAKVLIKIVGVNGRLVSGYPGTAQIRLAIESKEVDGMCWSWDSVAATAANWLDTNFARVPVYGARERDARVDQRFPDAKLAQELVTDPRKKALINAAQAASAVSKPFVAPPNTPADRLQALQDAFTATMKDPEFLADAQQARIDITPRTGPDALQIVNEILSLPADQARELGEVLK